MNDRETQADHADLVSSLKKTGMDINARLTPADCDLIHMMMGLSGEVGELMGAIKKHVIYRKPLDLANVIEELGDIEWYMQGLRVALDLDRTSILQYNIDKLNKRYGLGQYSDQQAQERADKT